MAFAYKIINGVIVDGILTDGQNSNASWSSKNNGGVWVDSEQPQFIGGLWDEEHGFRPPQPSPDCWWDGNRWVCPPELDLEFVDNPEEEVSPDPEQ
jgi:hypothetical protein